MKEKELLTFFKAISDPNRIKIMLLLKDDEMCVSDICKHFEMKQPSVSHHLNILKNAEVINSRREGKETYYRLNRVRVSNCCSTFQVQFLEKQAGE